MSFHSEVGLHQSLGKKSPKCLFHCVFQFETNINSAFLLNGFVPYLLTGGKSYYALEPPDVVIKY